MTEKKFNSFKRRIRMSTFAGWLFVIVMIEIIRDYDQKFNWLYVLIYTIITIIIMIYGWLPRMMFKHFREKGIPTGTFAEMDDAFEREIAINKKRREEGLL